MAKFPTFRTAILALFLALASLSLYAKTPMAQSVQPLQANGQTFCTAFSINEKEGLWETARHCAEVSLEKKWDVEISGAWAYIVYMAPGNDDVAIFQSKATAPSLPLSRTAPRVGDPVSVVGYPYGLPLLVTAKGFVAALRTPFQDAGVSDILDVTIAPGNSGSPVLDRRGAVVGVVWGRFNGSEHAISVPWETVVRLTGSYYSRIIDN